MKLKLLLLVVGLQALWMIGTTIRQESILARAQTILLETRPVDPRDTLRGDYLTLRYKISSLPKSIFTPALTNNLPQNQAIFVLLEKHGQFHEAVQASTNQLTAGKNQVLLKGHAEGNWQFDRSETESVTAKYGLERFYISEGTGNPTGKLTAEIAVAPSGNGLIKQVFVDGKPYQEAMRKQE